MTDCADTHGDEWVATVTYAVDKRDETTLTTLEDLLRADETITPYQPSVAAVPSLGQVVVTLTVVADEPLPAASQAVDLLDACEVLRTLGDVRLCLFEVMRLTEYERRAAE